MGTWPLGLNAVFNGTAHFLFILGVSMIFLPIFLGKLTVLRDIYAAQFFRPFARSSYTLACFSGLVLSIIFFSQQ